MTNIEKKIRIADLYPVLLQYPMLIKYFDLNSDELLDEKIAVLEMVKAGKNISEIPDFYHVFELLPKDMHWD